jgi:hypothetical protein
MNRVETSATRYLEIWNEQYARVNDTGICKWAVEAAMRDIESWIEGHDPNGAKEAADVVDWTEDEFRELYSILAPSASFFCYHVRQDYMSVTKRGEFNKQTVTSNVSNVSK